MCAQVIDGKCCIRVCSCVSFSKLDLRARQTFIAEKVGAILKNAPPDDVRNVTGLLAWLCMCVFMCACMYVCMCMCLCVYVYVFVCVCLCVLSSDLCSAAYTVVSGAHA